MRILHVVARSQRRGAETAAAELAAELDRRGHDDPIVALRSSFDGSTVEGAPVLSGRGDRLPSLAWRMRRELRRVRPDLVVAHGGEAAAVVALARGRSGPPIVWQRILDLPESLWASSLRRRWWSWIDRRCAAVVALTAELGDEQSRLGRTQQVWIIGNFRAPQRFVGVDRVRASAALRAELGIGSDVALVGLVGHLVPQKRPDRAVRLLAAVRAAGADAHLVVAGDGPLRQEVVGQVATAGLQGSVSLLGERTDVAAVLAALDVLVLVSDHEGIPGVLIEAQMTGCPVVTLEVGGVAEVVEDGVTGLVVTGGVDAVATALIGLLGDPERLASMRVAARARADRFDVARAADRYEEGFASLVD